MHESAHEHGRQFFELYWNPRFTDVVELGSQDVNGTLRDHAPKSAVYLGLDMIDAEGVDIVVTPGKPLPLPDASSDVIVTSSAFEHDACFWETFLDLLRVLRPGGLLYINAPSNGAFHRYPVDCWRFYPDAGVGLVEWATRNGMEVDLVESFIAEPQESGWADFIAIFRKAGPPLLRKGSMSDLSKSMNVRDIEKTGLQRESERTFDMIATEEARKNLSASEAELAEVQAANSALQTALAALTSSTSWKITAFARRLSSVVKGR